MSESVLNDYAQTYVNLILNKTRYDPWDLNWYTEGPFWRRTSMKFSRTYKMIPDYEIGEGKHGKSLRDICESAERLEHDLTDYAKTACVEEEKRVAYLREHAHQLAVRTRLLLGEKMNYDSMTRELYDLTAPACDHSRFDRLLEDARNVLPGSGDALMRIRDFRRSIRIPREHLLETVREIGQFFHDASRAHMDIAENNMPRFRVRELPGSMQFLSVLFGYDYDRIEYERNINLNYPWAVDNLIECIAHECEPGHLVYFEKRTKAFIDTGWPEMSVVSQHTSSNAFSEGAARQAILMCFDDSLEKMCEYERETVFDIAGIDRGLAAVMPFWYRFCEASGYGKLEATRNIWNGVWSLDKAGGFLEKYGFNELGSGVQTLEGMPDDAGHFTAHDYARDVARDFFRAAAPDVKGQWALYEALCGDDFSMKTILDHSYRLQEPAF